VRLVGVSDPGASDSGEPGDVRGRLRLAVGERKGLHRWRGKAASSSERAGASRETVA